ncbi:MAG: site-specific integrase [Prevotellaceae bacterium]|jgi:site-specific recombinase XerD|nr:site-specific integrase [Prevotellaceae bacterium]
MATYKIAVLTDNVRKDGSMPICVRITHEGDRAYIKLPYTAMSSEVDGKGRIKDSHLLRKVNPVHDRVGELLDEIGMSIGQFTAKTLKSHLVRKLFMAPKDHGGLDFFVFAKKYVDKMKADGRVKSAKNYELTRDNLKKFITRPSGLNFNEITANFCYKYHDWMISRGIGVRGQQLYLSCLRKFFNEAVREYNDYDTGETPITVNPFMRFKVPTPAFTNNAERKALSVETMRKIFAYEPKSRCEVVAKDVYMFSFCLCGINAVDIYNCDNLENNVLRYSRSKTKWRQDGSEMRITIPAEVQYVLDKYSDNSRKRVFDFYKKYVNVDGFNQALNRKLKKIGMDESVMVDNLTFYSARHSWATIATNDLNIREEHVDECLAHAPVRKMLHRYVKKDWSRIDTINRKVLDYVFENSTS